MTDMDENKAPKERVDVANEPVDLDENEMVDTGVLHELPGDPKPVKGGHPYRDGDEEKR